MHRPSITCTLVGGQYYLDAGNGHARYQWTTGETTQTISVTLPGTYSVFVPRGNGGFINSFPFDVANPLDPCNILTNITSPFSNEEISVYPNPITNKILIKNALNVENYELVNSMGKVIWAGKQIEEADFSGLVAGMYFLRVNDGGGQRVMKLLKL